MNHRRLVASCVAIAFAPTAHAQLHGKTLTADWFNPKFGDVFETHEITVGPHVELRRGDIIKDHRFSIDLDASTVKFEFVSKKDGWWYEDSFNGWCFTDAQDTLPEISGYSILSHSEGMGNVDAVVTGFSPDAFWADFGGLTFKNGASITLQVTFVPVPAAAIPLALGVVSMSRRRHS